MRRLNGVRIGILVTLCGMISVVCSSAPLYGQQVREAGREKIGEVFGKPVYRDSVRVEKEVPLRDELHRLFTAPIMQKYQQDHKAEIEPTEDEIAAAVAFFDKRHRERIAKKEPKLREQLMDVERKLGNSELPKEQRQKLEIERQNLQSELNQPGRLFALFMLNNWKFQKHLYDRYGGGRILWQQAGVEAFDAHRKWLEDREKQGDFKIADPKLRSTFYEYWTTMNHGSFLTDDKARIRSEFLEPQWMAKAPSKD